MISDWRGDRRIGPAPFRERAGPSLRLALIFLALIAVESVFVVFIKTLGHPLDWFSYIRLWALFFGLQAGIIAVVSLFGPRKGLALTLGALGGGVAVLAWVLAGPLLRAFGVVMIVPIP